MPTSIHYVTHEGEGLARIQRSFGVRVEDLAYSQGQGWAVEKIRANFGANICPVETGDGGVSQLRFRLSGCHDGIRNGGSAWVRHHAG